jgi:hypothetical protein
MNLIMILIISIINVLIMSVAMTFFLIKGYEHLVMEKVVRTARKKGDSPESEPLIMDQMRKILKNFNIYFIVLEFTLIFYFVFWATILYLTLI